MRRSRADDNFTPLEAEVLRALAASNGVQVFLWWQFNYEFNSSKNQTKRKGGFGFCLGRP